MVWADIAIPIPTLQASGHKQPRKCLFCVPPPVFQNFPRKQFFTLLGRSGFAKELHRPRGDTGPGPKLLFSASYFHCFRLALGFPKWELGRSVPLGCPRSACDTLFLSHTYFTVPCPSQLGHCMLSFVSFQCQEPIPGPSPGHSYYLSYTHSPNGTFQVQVHGCYCCLRFFEALAILSADEPRMKSPPSPLMPGLWARHQC